MVTRGPYMGCCCAANSGHRLWPYRNMKAIHRQSIPSSLMLILCILSFFATVDIYLLAPVDDVAGQKQVGIYEDWAVNVHKERRAVSGS